MTSAKRRPTRSRSAHTKTVIDNFALVSGGYVPFHKAGSYSDVLPSLVVKKNVRDDMVFRFGVGETITRPPTNILGAVGRINLVIDDPTTPENEAESSSASLPNPDSKPQRGTNYDASLEWYFSDASAVALVSSIRAWTTRPTPDQLHLP